MRRVTEQRKLPALGSGGITGLSVVRRLPCLGIPSLDHLLLLFGGRRMIQWFLKRGLRKLSLWDMDGTCFAFCLVERSVVNSE